jgi:hypothetical protein
MYKLLNTLTLALSLKGEGSKFAPPLRGEDKWGGC